MPPTNNPLREAMRQNAANSGSPLPSETTFNPLAEEMRRQRKIEREQQAQTLAASPDAQTAAKAKKLTQGTPVKPSEVISDVEAAQRMVRAKRLLELSDNSPAVAKALEQGDLATAASLVDEQEKVGWFADFFGKLPARLGVAGTSEAAGGLRSSITDPLEQAADYAGYAVRAPIQIVGEQLGVRFREDPDEWLERRQSERRDTTRQFIEYADATRAANRSDNFWVEAALAGTEFVPVSVVAALTRNPRVAAGIPAAAVAGSSLERARAQGLTGTSALAYGAVQGGIEYLTEKMPASTLVDAIVNKSPFGRTLMRTLGQEIPGEQIATITQDFVDWGVLPDNRDKTFGDYLAERPEAALATLVGTVSGTGLNVALTRGIGRTAEVSLGMANKAIMARQAKAEGKALRELMDSAGGSAMRETDPEGFARLMRDMAEERGLTSVLVDGKAAREYMQSDDYNPESDPLAPFADDVLDAAAAGGDIAVPVEIALTSMPGTRAWETLKDDMRLTPGADTVREAQAFEEGQEEIAAQMDAAVSTRQSVEGEQQGVRERLVSSLQEKLENDGGYAPYQAKQMAELFAARAINRQSRSGRDAEQAVEDFNVRMVLPPELQRSLAAQEQDMVLAILRGNEQGSTSRARAAAGELTTILERRGWTPSDLTDEQLGEVISKLAEQGVNDGRREYRAGDQRGGSGSPRRSEALDGAPRAKGFHGPIEGIVAAAEAYAEQTGIDYRRQAEYVTKETFDEERAARLAQAYEEMEHSPSDPAVAEAYADMMAQTRAQYDVLVEMGYEFYFLDPDSEYAQSPFNALRELRDAQRMGVFSTSEGFGSDDTFDPAENPLLTDTGLTWKNAAGEDVPVLANDLFRAVHDAFGHGLEGAGFRYDGEENAWQAHARLYTGAALGAMTTETRGQNSWLNFGPHGETNRFAPVEETVFADQKTGLMPAWTSTEGKVADMAPIYEQPEQVLAPGEVATSAAEGTSIGWTEQRVDDLLRAFAYPSEPERTKAYAVRMSPDEFLGLTASEQGRALIEERVTQGEEYSGGEVDFDRMRANSQPIFLIAQVEPERQVLDIDSDDNATITLPEEMRVVGHEGRHRMTMLKRAGITSVPVVIMLQSKVAPTSDSTTARPQRSAMERVSTGDQPADLEGLEPISYANEARLREAFGTGRELFQPAYHGSPHIFDRFSLDAIGTGEGAQAYGWGLYFAGKKEIAQFYRDELGGEALVLPDGHTLPVRQSEEARKAVADFAGMDGHGDRGREVARIVINALEIADRIDGKIDLQDAAFQAGVAPYNASPDEANMHSTAEDIINDLVEAGAETQRGRLYEVEIPEDDEYLLWDRPLREQPEPVRKALEDMGLANPVTKPDIESIEDTAIRAIVRKALRLNGGETRGIGMMIDNESDLYDRARKHAEKNGIDDDALDAMGGAGEYVKQQASDFLSQRREYELEDTGADIYNRMVREMMPSTGSHSTAQKFASLDMLHAGIAGIKYLDGGSRDAGDGTFNYVVFDDNRIAIRAYEQATIFYSALERAAEAVSANRAPAQQWIATLKKAPGVKQEELEWTGLLDWLEVQKGPVEKAQVIETIQRGGIVVREVVLQPITEDDLDPASVDETIADREYEFYDYWESPFYVSERAEEGEDGEPVTTWVIYEAGGYRADSTDYDSEEDAQAEADEMNNSAQSEAYSEWENEVRSEVVEYLLERERESGDGDVKWQDYSLSGNGDQSYRELLITLPPGEGGNPNDYVTGTHWDAQEDQGVVAHARFFEARGPNRERILFLDEIQSDWHQMGRDEGYNRGPSDADLEEAEALEQSAREKRNQAMAALRELTMPVAIKAREIANETMDAQIPMDRGYGDTDILAAARGQRGQSDPKIVEALATFEQADNEHDRAREFENAVERGADPQKYREQEKALAGADKALEVVDEETKVVFAKLQKALRPALKRVLDGYREEAIETYGDHEDGAAAVENFVRVKRNELRADYVESDVIERGSFMQLLHAAGMIRRALDANDFGPYEAGAEREAADLQYAKWRQLASERSLRQNELDNLRRGGSIPDAPFKDTWPVLVMKRVTAWAAAEGFDQVAWVKQGENNGGMNDNVDWFYGRNLPNMTNKFLKPYKVKVKPLRVEGRTVAEGASPRRDEIVERMAALRADSAGVANAAGALEKIKEQTEEARRRTQNWIEDRERQIAERRADYEAALAQKEAGVPESELEIGSLTWAEDSLAEWQAELDQKKAMLDKTADWDAMVPMIEEYRALQTELREVERTAPTNLGFDITPELREAAVNGFPLFQPDHRDGPRGRILFDGDTADGALIELFQNRNLSTLLHEVSHLWLEELKQDAADPNASEQVKRDYETVLAWFKDNGHEVRDGIIPVGAHEMFARGGERYFREGKAPAIGLQRAFEAFRNWLVDIYKSVTGLRAPITPEIREVFDRLIASDEEIEIAREQQALNALFDSAADAGMSEGEFASYQEQVANARAEASGKVLEKAMKAIRDREKRLYQNRRREVEERVTDTVEGEPLFRALSTLRRDRMDRVWLVETFGEDVFDRLPVRVPPVWQENGSDPEMIAEASGYSTATAMVEALIAAHAEQQAAVDGGDKRNLKTRTIQNRVDMQMAAEFGDPMTDGQIEEEARAALHGERQGEVQASEIKALSRKTGQRPTPYKMAREWARGRVRSGDYSSEASPAALQRHQRAITRAGKEAELALAAGDHEAALRAKQQQMLSSALYAEAKAANEEIEAARARMKKVADKRTMASVDQDYLEQAHALMEAVDLKARSQASIDRQGQWSAWVAAQEAEGFEIVVPPEFEARIGTTHWTRLPIEQLLGLDEAVKQVVHIGRFKQRLLDNRDQRDFAAIKREISEQADAVGRKEPKGRFDPTGSDRSFWERVKSGVANADAALMKMEEIFDRLDNGKPDGVFNRLIFRPISDAASRERDMLRDFYSKMRANMETIDDETLKRWNEKITPGWFDIRTGKPDVLTRQQVIAMALNWGNLGNRQRLVDGYGLRESQVEKFLMDTLSESEWQFVQRTWDIINELWPEIAAMERRVNGVEPEKIEATAIQTPFGALRGGYYPAIYDTTKDRKAKGYEELGDDLMSAKTVRATTRASATKERSETVKRPILLDLGVINRHMGEVIHDITHREVIINANRILSDPEVMDEADAVLGPEYSAQFRPWLKFIANQWAHDRAGNEGWGRFFTKARANATVVGMGFRFTTIMTQLAGFSNSMEYVGAARMTAEIAKASANPIDTFNFVMGRSAEMRSRVETLDRDINAELRNLARPSAQRKATDALTSAKRFAFHGIGYMDRMVSIPTWMGGYNRAIEGGATEEQAIYEGDKAVRLSQGNAEAKDLAAVSRGTGQWGGALKLLTMFYSYMSAFYQRQRRFMWDSNRALRDRDLAAFPGLLSRAFFLFIVPPLLAEFLSGRGPEEDEDAAWWAFRKMVSQMLGPIPVVRDIWEPAWARATDAPSFGYRFTPAQGAVESAINVVGDAGNIVEGEETKRATRNTLEFVGYSTGLVPGQFASAAQFIVDVSEGDQDPDDMSEWFEGLTKGRVSED